MRVAFISGSYRAKTIHEVVDNIRHAEAYAKKYWKLGYAVICPHKNTALFDGLLDDSVWLDGDMELLRRSDVIVFIPGWEDSEGARAEYEVAKTLNKEIIIEKGPS
jgi:hypothetical protein